MVVYRNQMVQRELSYAIIDEVDSILIDEARTPLIISGQSEKSTDMYGRANQFVRRLERGPDVQRLTRAEQIMGEQEEEHGDYVVDVKARTVQLTQQGIDKAEKYFNVENLSDTENTELNHHIIQALRANVLFTRDKDYVVQDGQVLIVDEFTGRLMLGRRYSDGLHQALEAKEGVKVERENRTLATITFQNFFRMYDKISGMTGTAKTEEAEFQGIYDMDVVEIPTNKPMIRVDYEDSVYATEAGKFRAVADEIAKVHAAGQPILVGTISVERSEYLSAMLTRRGIRHEVLNAKQHAREAQIVAQAGKKGAVTIATNMAGRGTDILLGGNPEFLARQALRQEGMEEALIEEATGHAETADTEILDARKKYQELYERFKRDTDAEHDEVVALGGLHIIGTERHESRRIDDQLRGRSGRQGDPGSSRFYVSLQDELMVRFGAERVSGIMNRLSPDDDIPIEMGLITKQIENAQKRVEMHNFEIRKNVLRYDDVMNKQREIIYKQRRQVLMGEDMHAQLQGMIETCAEELAAFYCPEHLYSEEWDFPALEDAVCELCAKPRTTIFDPKEYEDLNIKEVRARLTDFVKKAYDGVGEMIDKFNAERPEGAPKLELAELERTVLLRNVDTQWMDHIDAMDQLRQGIGLRAYGQKDPVAAYTSEGFDMFDEMVQRIRENTVRMLLHISIQSAPKERTQVAQPNKTPSDDAAQPQRAGNKPGRNQPCPCGSGKKYKNCCGKNDV